jgi:hypothetical protein|tara:strand:+ start:192 stop:1550 length:1359 start_codon:yes stop_codon:yes gene_type:complete
MAILDRPMFQRPLTKDQLRGYGLPAFANGGVVRMNNGGGVDLGYTESGAISGKPPFNMFKRLTLEEYERMSPQEVLKAYAGLDNMGVAKGMQESAAEGMDILKGFADVKDAQSATQKRKERREQEKNKTFTDVIKELGEEDEKKTPREKRAEEKKKEVLESQKAMATREDAANMQAGAKSFFEANNTVSGTEGTSGEGDPLPDPVVDEDNRLSKLQDIIKERSDLYKKLLGDPKEQLKQQGFLQLAQFGLNLAAARGGNLAEKIAKSATDPLQTFAALARDASKDERAIELAAIESGEKQLLTEIESEADLSTIGKSVRDIARIKNIPINEAYGVYETLLKDDPKTATSFERFTAAQDSQNIPNNVAAARSAGAIPSTLLLDTSPFIVEGGYDKKMIQQKFFEGEGFKFQDNETGKIFMGIPKDSSLQDKKKKVLTIKDDFLILEDIDVFNF